MTATPWRSALLGHLQELFAKDTEWLFWHTRLDRASFAYSQDGLALKLRFAGVCIHPTADAVRVLLPRRLDQESAKWLKLPRPAKPQVEFGGIRRLDNPSKRLQAIVPEWRALDGVRIDNAYFDPQGRFGLIGLWKGAPQTVELESLLKSALRGEEEILLTRGLNWQQMIPVASDKLLKELRTWTTRNLEESYLETLFFDDSGRLTLKGFCKKGPQANIKAAEAQLSKRMDALLGTRSIRPSAVMLVQHSQSLTDHLRAQVPRDAALDGLRIDHGIYDADGRFLLSGVQDHRGQAEHLDPLLRAAAETTEWAQQLPNGWRIGTFDPYPLRPLLDTLARKMPIDPVFDGVIFTRAFYDAQGQLVFAGTVVGRPTRPGIEDRIKRMLNLDTHLGVRVSLQAQKKEIARAEQATAIALGRILAGDFVSSVPLLDLALLHDPEDTTSWYLRAACNLTQGDPALAERDLRRLISLERNNDNARRARYRRLERFQGGLRMRIDALIDQFATEAL
jgi:hypothetical protein